MDSILVLLLFCVIDVTLCGNLTCFYCHDTGSNRGCWDEKSLKNAALNGNDFVRECNESRSEDYCVIERFMQHGRVDSLIRDCNNRKDFSVPQTGRLKNIYPDNTTVCSFDPKTGSYLVCISLCKDSFCNGPINANPNNSFSKITFNYIIGFLAFSLQMLQTI